jgi:hypothetical protein
MKRLASKTTANIGSYMKFLENGEFIISNKSYVKGLTSKAYCINPKYLDSGVVYVDINSGSKLFEKMNKNQLRKKTHYSRNEKPFLREMRKHFWRIELNYEEAKKYCLKEANQSKRLHYLISIEQLKDKRLRYFKRNKTNDRLDTNLTNLKSELKQFMIGDYVSIDLKNSQPFFLSQLIKVILNNNTNTPSTLCNIFSSVDILKSFGIKRIKKILKISQNQENEKMANFREFENSVISGTFYDEFVSKYGSGIDRKKVKDIMFKVLFSQNFISDKYKKYEPYKEEKEIFKSVYPFIYDVIYHLKEGDNKLLPIYLQKLESYVFIDCIAEKLVLNGIVPLTIHDSVIVEKKQEKSTIQIIIDVFYSKFRSIPQFEIKSLK